MVQQAAPIHFIHIKGGFQRLGFVESNDSRYVVHFQPHVPTLHSCMQCFRPEQLCHGMTHMHLPT